MSARTDMIERSLELRLEGALGVPFDVQVYEWPFRMEVALRTDLKDGFRVVCEQASRVRLRLRLVADDYSGPLFDTMASASPDMREECRHRLRDLKGMVQSLVCSTGGTSLVDADCAVWPSRWRGIDYHMVVFPLEDYEDFEQLASIAYKWARLMLTPLFALLKVSKHAADGFEEGNAITIEMTRYERDPRNRAICIEYNGVRCVVCGMDFGETYGPIGLGFINVHHVTPVSTVGAGHLIDPRRDLVPVCPNCHAMLHRRNPPLLPEELRAILAKYQGN